MPMDATDLFEQYRLTLKNLLSYVEDNSFSWDDVIGLLIIQLKNTDSLNKTRTVSHATQIQLTSERDGLEEKRQTEDFFPTLTLNSSFKSWRISIPARISLYNVERLGEPSITTSGAWKDDKIQIRRRLLNDDGSGNGNPALHICYGDDLMLLRERLHVDDYLVIVKRKSEQIFEAFGVRKDDANLGNGKNMYLANNAQKDSTAFEFNTLLFDNNRLKGGRNVLLYGVPGSGKSHTIKHEYCKNAYDIERVVFHPDYTYGDFVGQILPITDDDGKIRYKFTAGPFTRILRKAYLNPCNKYCLIIEEINRGNAPAIFGDVFQLLDRDEKGNSTYDITNADVADIVYGAESGMKLSIPSNLFIFATMNTSDQNVFTLDTAFQRRWDMRMVENNVAESKIAKFNILDTDVTWETFNKRVNELILAKNVGMVSSEDKRLGAYFVTESDLHFYTTEDGLDQKEADDKNHNFPEKVLKYLWDDAFKFVRDEVFKEEFDSLEKLIKAFETKNGNSRFDIFLDDIFNLSKTE